MTLSNSNTHNYGDYSFHYKTYGNGQEIVLCFHGFSESADSFEFLEKEYGKRYTFYAFDFLFHGQTKTKTEDVTITKSQWSKIIIAFLDKNKIQRVKLMGYSMGGRLSMVLIENIPERIERVFLLAPDGIWKSTWFKFATTNWLGKRLFKHFTYYPKPYYIAIDLLYRVKIIPRRLRQMAIYNTGTKEKREQVYWTWIVLSQLNIDLECFEKKLKTHNIPLDIMVGRYDKVIPPAKLKSAKWTNQHIHHLHLTEDGHILAKQNILKIIDKTGFLKTLDQ